MTQEANIKPASSISVIWLVPLIVICVGGWMIYHQWKNQGPLITIELTSASGIEINKTPIKVKDLDVGIVKKLFSNPI